MVRFAILATAACAAAAPLSAVRRDGPGAETPSLLMQPAGAVVANSFDSSATTIGSGAPAVVPVPPHLAGIDMPSLLGGQQGQDNTQQTPTIAAAAAPAAPVTVKVNSTKIITDLGKSATIAFVSPGNFSGNGILGAGINAGVDTLFSIIPDSASSGPSSLEQFQADVTQRLQDISGELTSISETLQQVVGIDTQILMGIQDLKLNQVLDKMTVPSGTIEDAFNKFGNWANLIANPNTSNSTRTRAIAKVYGLLTDDSTYGPDKVFQALLDYQSFVLDSAAGAKGVLSFVPTMVQSGWEACAKDYTGAQDYSRPLNDNHGAFYDSVAHIADQCVKQAYTNLADNTGRTVQAVFGNILLQQLRGFALLTAAFGKDPLQGQNKLAQAAAGISAIYTQMNALWAQITTPSFVDSTATRLLPLYGQTLGAARAGEYWSTPVQSQFSGIPASLNAGFITTTCPDPATRQPSPCLMAPGALNFNPNQDVATAPGTSFYYFRAGLTLKLSQDVLAPICWCGDKICSEDNSGNDDCKNQFGEGWRLHFNSDTDKYGKSCGFNTWVPICGKPDGKVEYTWYKDNTVTARAPHANLPQMPAFLQEIQIAQ